MRSHISSKYLLCRSLIVVCLFGCGLSWLDTKAESSEANERADHWAFRPLPLRNTSLGDCSIDAYIESALSKERLTLFPEADLRTLIRRLYFDLVGLPPDATKLVYLEHANRDLESHVRGDPNRPGDSVPRGFFTVFGGGSLGKDSDARLEWAESIFDQAGGLAARVIVNRVWKEHFGEGIVATPGNFGLSGAAPTHRELLDDLAARFVAHGWSLKWLHREILLSRTWRQTSRVHAPGQMVDPQNRLLWHMSRQRLPVESWRDAMLLISGRLDRSFGGASQDLSLPENVRRTVYGTVHRRDLNVMLKLHDFPDPNRYSEQRINTTTPVQQLFALNGPFVWDCSLQLADRIMARCGDGLSGWVTQLFRQVWGRSPTSEEEMLFESYFQSETVSNTHPREILARCAQTCITSNAFLYVD